MAVKKKVGSVKASKTKKKIVKKSKAKIAAKRPPAKKAVKRSPAKGFIARLKSIIPFKKDSALEKIGEVTHYFPKVRAAAVKILKDGLKRGDKIYIKGHTTKFEEDVKSIQLDHATIEECGKGQEIGLLVKSRVRIGDIVYKVKK